uniref:calcium permeable stress-gated cation channel 1 n=1 Tax=Pristiophorus japonicus TaxID=55135 RepID=UPI00398E759E
MDSSPVPQSSHAVSKNLAHVALFNFLDSLANGTVEQCYSARSRSTVLQGLSFGGVPTVLAINFILWLALLFIFSCLRKAAWDYGRLALLMDNDSLTSLFYGEPTEKEKSPSESSPTELESKDVGFCSWLTTLYNMRDDEIQYKCGIDAIIYLSFQRHILVLLTVICVLSIAIVLPVNFSGDLLGDSPQHFGRTTIVNVPADDRLLWLHSIFALLYFVVTVVCMGHHALQLDYKENEKVARTLMISQIPKEITDANLVTKHFHEAYPSCTVTDVQFCFDVRALMKLDLERRKAMKGRLYFTAKAQKEGKIMIKTHPLARICCCNSCGFDQVDAEQYYSELEEKLTDEFNAERNRITLKRLGMGFVTFQDERMTAVCVFLPDNGAFFVNYVITSSLIGTAMELLRIPGLLVYAARLVFAKSKAEQLHVKKNQAYEYQFGLEYAWTMCIFAVVMTYSITCPIIVPFGLLYMLLKHLVDRYNIYYACLPTKLNHRLHAAAISQVIIAPILCMFWLLFFSVLRLGPVQPITLFTFVTLLLCIVFSLFAFCMKGLHKLKSQNYQMADQQSDGVFTDGERSSVSSTPNSHVFVAAVLQDPELGLTPAASPAHQTYGTMENRADETKSEDSSRMQNVETDLESEQHEPSRGSVMERETRYH